MPSSVARLPARIASRSLREYAAAMNVVAHGIDLVECDRIAVMLDKHRERFLRRILTVAENQRAEQYKIAVPFVAGRWAAKEAILKMIGTGWRGQIAWTDMEILPNNLGEPIVALGGETARRAEALGITRVMLSITHTKQYAAASALGVSE